MLLYFFVFSFLSQKVFAADIQLFVARDTTTLAVTLESSYAQLIGKNFSHKKLLEIQKKFQETYDPFQIDPKVFCKITKRKLAPSDSNMHLTITYHCKNFENLKNISLNLFQDFPLVKKALVQLVTDENRYLYELNPKRNQFLTPLH